MDVSTVAPLGQSEAVSGLSGIKHGGRPAASYYDGTGDAGARVDPPQWQLLATPGHVLLAQVDLYRHKQREPLLWGAAGIAIIIAALVAAPWLGQVAGWVVGKLTGAAYYVATSKLPDEAPAPQLRRIAPIAAGVEFDERSQIPSITDARDGIAAQMELMKSGKRTSATECDFSKKITEPWAATGEPVMPHCRYSKDGTRMWVWGIVNDNNRLKGLVGLIRKDSNGQVAYWGGEGDRLASIPDFGRTLDQQLVPRALAADLPELITR